MIGNLVARISIFFTKNYRITVLIALATLGLGIVSYTTLLQRKGFPSIEVPIVVVQTPYFVNDLNIVDESITKPLEDSFGRIIEVNQINATTTENFSVLVIQFEESITSKEGAQLLKDDLSQNVQLPDGVEVTFQTIDAGSIDGTNDLLFFISDPKKSVTEMQEIGADLAQEIALLPEVGQAEVIEQFQEQTNPITGDTNTERISFARIATKDNDELRFNNAVAIGVIQQSDAIGTLELSDAVRNKIDELSQDGEMLFGFTVSYGGDFADSLSQQIKSLEDNALSGLIAVVAVLFFFISFRASLVTALFMPIVMSGTFIGLYFIGYSLNTIVLFSLVLVLGLFVDDAIVVVEAIDYQKRKGNKGLSAVREAVKTIGTADISGTLTTVLVFTPMLFISGVLGDFIELIPVTVILALLLSLLFALTLIPLLSYIAIVRFGSNFTSKFFVQVSKVFAVIPNSISGLGNVMSRFVQWYLSHKTISALVLVITLVLIIFGTSFASKLSFSVFPQPKDSDVITVNLTFTENTDIEHALILSESVESRILVSEKYIDEIFYTSGNETSASLQATLVPYSQRDKTAHEIADDINASTDNIQGVEIKAQLLGAGPPESEYPFTVQIFDENTETLYEATSGIAAFLQDSSFGDSISVTETKISGINTITKQDGERFAQVQAKLSDTSNTGILLTIQEALTEHYTEDELQALSLNESALSFDLGQESENLASFNSTIFALLGAVVIMYALLVVQFNSFTQPVLILLAIPMGFVGLFPGLYATNNPLSFFVMLGIIGLVGIVVNNSIMLIDLANQSRAEGDSIVNSIRKAVSIRFRPIVTTSTTTIAGLLPLALSDPFWESLAFTIIFGLISSSILVVLALPVFYAIIEYFRNWKSSHLPKLIEE